MDNAKRQLLESHSGEPIAAIDYMPGGCVGEVWRVRFESGRQIVAKSSSYGDHLHIEGQMLEYLKTVNQPIPQVLLVRPDFLAMEYIETTEPTKDSPVNLARVIADLHACSAAQFGFDYDTLIGPLPQANQKSSSWVEFYATSRLLYMARLAREADAVSDDFCRDLETLCGRLGDYLSEPSKPSLMHGDLWFGNVLYRAGGEISLIDPAIYYGDGEADIAYSQMFGGIGEAFIKEYSNLRPLSENFFTERLPLYHLYPLLVHARLFGAHYGAQAQRIVKKFI